MRHCPSQPVSWRAVENMCCFMLSIRTLSVPKLSTLTPAPVSVKTDSPLSLQVALTMRALYAGLTANGMVSKSLLLRYVKGVVMLTVVGNSKGFPLKR